MPTPPNSPSAPRRTRLAPSPTGALHLGNVRTFLINFAHAKQTGSQIVMRVEDLDTPRVKAGADMGALDLLAWLGMTWDEGPFYQAHDLSPYQQALDQLADQGQAYPCGLSRKDIEQALSAPDADDEKALKADQPATLATHFPGVQLVHDTHYPGLSRHRLGESLPALGQTTANQDNIRFLVPDTETAFDDHVAGHQSANIAEAGGDFLIATKVGLPSYQLAVVVDDARHGITDIVRGDDLIPSTHRQLHLQRALGLPTPAYWHVPLVVGTDGRRLAKRHGDTRVSHYREQGVPAEKIIGLIAHWSGVLPEPAPLSLDAFVDGFAWDQLPQGPVVHQPQHEQWLRP